jgi:DNA-binding PadR family transcriptional regulator
MQASWPSENLLLGLLAEQPMHGYELARLVRTDEALRSIWHLKRSEVYFLLGKLLAQGHIIEVTDSEQGPTAQKDQAGRPPRVLYTVTPGGLEALIEWLMTPERSPRDLRVAFLVKLYLASRRDSTMALELVERQRQVLTQWQDRLQPVSTANSFVGVVHKLRLAQVVAAISALDDMRAMLEALA